MLKTFFKGILWPVAVASLMALICRPLYMHDGSCDLIMLIILIGIPFGIGKMMVWFVPLRMDIGSTIGVFVFDILIGGIIGIFVLAFQIISSVLLLFTLVTKSIIH